MRGPPGLLPGVLKRGPLKTEAAAMLASMLCQSLHAEEGCRFFFPGQSIALLQNSSRQTQHGQGFDVNKKLTRLSHRLEDVHELRK